jgi:hypothetical protein
MRYNRLALAFPALLGLAALFPQAAAAQFGITANFVNTSLDGTSVPGAPPSTLANADVQNALNYLATQFQTNGTTPFNMTANIEWSDQGYSATNGYTLGGSLSGADNYQTVGGILVNNDLDRYLYGSASTVNTGGSYADFNIILNDNPNVPWNYTMANDPTNSDSSNLASVMYHESIHSMGFSAYNNADGTYSFTTNGGTGTAAPTIWDTHLFDKTTNQLFTLDTPAQRAAAMVSGDANDVGSKLYFTGMNANLTNGGNLVQMSAPSTFVEGSSDGSHIDPNQPGAGLLYPALQSGVYLTPTPLELSMLSDIGWKLSAAPEPSQYAGLGLGTLGLAGLALKARRRKATANA